MAKSKDIWEKALDRAEGDEEARIARKAIEKQRSIENTEMVMRGIPAAAAALVGWAGGRKLVRMLSKGRYAKKGNMLTITPVIVGGGGAYLGSSTGKYPLHDARKKRSRK